MKNWIRKMLPAAEPLELREVAPAEIIDAPPVPSVRDAVLNFAAQREQGFIDEELYTEFPTVSPSQLRTRRNELWRDGFIVGAGRGTNEGGRAVRRWVHIQFTGQPAQPKAKRPTYAQLNQMLKTAQLQIEIRDRHIAELEARLPIVQSKE